MEGRLEKLKKNFALLEQPALRDNNKTVAEIIKEAIAATGENIQVCECVCGCACVCVCVCVSSAGKLGEQVGLHYGRVAPA